MNERSYFDKISHRCPECSEYGFYVDEYDSDEDVYHYTCTECGYSEWIEEEDETWK